MKKTRNDSVTSVFKFAIIFRYVMKLSETTPCVTIIHITEFHASKYIIKTLSLFKKSRSESHSVGPYAEVNFDIIFVL